MQEIIRLHISGRDRTGLVSQFMGVLALHNVNILDMGQSVIHDHISLALLIEIPPQHTSSPVLKDLLFLGHDLDMHIDFTPVALGSYESWVLEQGKERRIITVLAQRLTAGQLAAVTEVIAEHDLNIDLATRLSGRVSLIYPEQVAIACIQFAVSGWLRDESAMRAQLFEVSQRTGVDISFHVDDIYRRNRRLVAFDMDSTLIQAEVINELAKEAGSGEKVAAITEAAMRGEIDYVESLTRRVATLEGLEEEVLAQVAARLPLTDGVNRVLQTLNTLGYKTAILSGGFDYFGHYLQERLDIDYVYANRLEIIDGKLTGRVVGEIVDGKRKAELLRKIAEKENLKLAQTIAVGDGANDLAMLSVAGLGIAFHAKPIVRQQAQTALSGVGMTGLLYLIGIRDREIIAQNEQHTE